MRPIVSLTRGMQCAARVARQEQSSLPKQHDKLDFGSTQICHAPLGSILCMTNQLASILCMTNHFNFDDFDPDIPIVQVRFLVFEQTIIVDDPIARGSVQSVDLCSAKVSY